ncbi:hypothetical protein SAMN05428936_10764 [Pelagibacterium halotolerans]|nr:hypothetical protein SAMN05428936_10764 [Pelagibacterium halotolerans]
MTQRPGEFLQKPIFFLETEGYAVRLPVLTRCLFIAVDPTLTSAA